MHCSLSRDERRENSALFFVKGQEETKVNKKRKQCTVLCQEMRGNRSINKYLKKKKIVHHSLSRVERRLRLIKGENSKNKLNI